MQKIFLTLICFCFTFLVHSEASNNYYQIDLIAFIHQRNASQQEMPDNPVLVMSNKKNIHLQSEITDALVPFCLRHLRHSNLNKEYRLLKHQPQYEVLFHYSWLQPANNQLPVKLPVFDHNGWQVSGTIRIRQSNYYLLNSEFYFNNTETTNAFAFNEKQRLKDNTLYYLDHPQAGILIKVHKLG